MENTYQVTITLAVPSGMNHPSQADLERWAQNVKIPGTEYVASYVEMEGSYKPSPYQSRRERAAETLGKIDVGDDVVFHHDGVRYSARVLKINTTTATVRITKIEGTPRRRISVGVQLRVGAGILARG